MGKGLELCAADEGGLVPVFEASLTGDEPETADVIGATPPEVVVEPGSVVALLRATEPSSSRPMSEAAPTASATNPNVTAKRLATCLVMRVWLTRPSERAIVP